MSRPGPQRLKALVCDEPEWVRLTVEVLLRLGIETTIANTIERARSHLVEQGAEVNLLVTELTFDSRTYPGLRLIRQARNSLPNLGIVCVTFITNPFVLAQAWEFADAILGKPYEYGEFIYLVWAALNRSLLPPQERQAS